ncbi:TPA: hypothetical protein NJ353_004610 [Vibrio parahaemolyticus]|nr:hypothetical protein [Vibrio parahaemolyticus]HCH0725932.1 hypothetical protein [Vibrio parahaemolyticus]HCH1054488.1 hypothetical protein [Vibrio parahaemolyticus]
MKLYNAELKKNKSKTDVFKHFAITLSACANRVEGMFTSQQRCTIAYDGRVDMRDDSNRIIGSKTLQEHLVQFSVHASDYAISTYDVDIKKSLRLNDLWDDDPIASGGLGIVSEASISSKEFNELKVLFGPFKNAWDFKQVPQYYSFNDIKTLKRRYKTNKIYQNEYAKRKNRARVTNDAFSPELELIWLDLTLKLRNWCIEKGYDSFVYSNTKEGTGEDSYVCLLPNQSQEIDGSLFFLAEKYEQEAPGKVLKHVKGCLNPNMPIKVIHALWAGEAPLSYWEELR